LAGAGAYAVLLTAQSSTPRAARADDKRESKVLKEALLMTGSAQVYSQELATSVAEYLQTLEKVSPAATASEVAA